MKNLFIPAFLLLAACNNSPVDEAATKDKSPRPVEAASVKLYALECGRIEMLNLGIFDIGGEYDGRTNSAVSSCYLIRHPNGDLLWDTGVPDALHEQEGGITAGAFHISVPNTLSGQLQEIGLAPEDIEYLSVSHSHFDHVGNAGQYAASTFIAHEDEYAHLFRDAARKNQQNFAAYSALETSKSIKFRGNHDVFGDGTVTIIDAPGHTPGHTFLQLELKNAGTVLLSGDLYHLNEAREKRTIPTFNTDVAQTKASMDKFEALAKEKNARVIIQHSAQDFEALPNPPEYLD